MPWDTGERKRAVRLSATARQQLAPTVPDTFTQGMWSLADSPSSGGNTLTLTINALPDNGGAVLSDIHYRVNGGNPQALGVPAMGAYQIAVPAGQQALVEIRAVNTIGPSGWSDVKVAQPTPLVITQVPSRPLEGDWALTDQPSATGDRLNLNIIALPSGNGLPITALQYQLNGGAIITLSGTGTGIRSIVVPANQPAGVAIRGVNSLGPGPWSSIKEATPSQLIAATAPAQFSSSAWSLTAANSLAGDQLTVTINSLPNTGGSPLTLLRYRLNGVTIGTLSGTSTGSRLITVPAGAAANVEIQAVNAIGEGPWSAVKTATPTTQIVAPAQFPDAGWTLTDSPSTTGDRLNVNITALPSAGGGTITVIEYQLNGGSWRALSGVSPGTRQITVPAGQPANVALRAVNEVGPGPASGIKTATPTSTAVAPTRPAAFTDADWTLESIASPLGDKLRVTILTLPNNGGSPIDELQWKLNGGTISIFPGTTPGVYEITVPAGVEASVQIRANNPVGTGLAWSPAKKATPTATGTAPTDPTGPAPALVPATMTVAQWALADRPTLTGDQLTLTITALPADNGSPLTALQYQLNGGAITTLDSLATGSRIITVPVGQPATIAVRAVNANGPAPWSATRTVTPTQQTSTGPTNPNDPIPPGTGSPGNPALLTWDTDATTYKANGPFDFGENIWKINSALKPYSIMRLRGYPNWAKFLVEDGDIRSGDPTDRHRAELSGSGFVYDPAVDPEEHWVGYWMIHVRMPWSHWSCNYQSFDERWGLPGLKLEDYEGAHFEINTAGRATVGSAGRTQIKAFEGVRLPLLYAYWIVWRIKPHGTSGEADWWVNGNNRFSIKGIPLGSGPAPRMYDKIGLYCDDDNKPAGPWEAIFSAPIIRNGVNAGAGWIGTPPTPLPPPIANTFPIGSYPAGLKTQQDGQTTGGSTGGSTGGGTTTPPTTIPSGANMLLTLPAPTIDTEPVDVGAGNWNASTQTLTLTGTGVSYGARAYWKIPTVNGKTYTLGGDMSGGSMNWRVGLTPNGTEVSPGGTLAAGSPIVSFVGNGQEVYLRLNRQSTTMATFANMVLVESGSGAVVLPPPQQGGDLLDVITPQLDTTDASGQALWNGDTDTLTLQGTGVSFGAMAIFAVPTVNGKVYTMTGDMTGGSSATMNWRVGSVAGQNDLEAGGTIQAGSGRSFSWVGNGQTNYLRLNRQAASQAVFGNMSLIQSDPVVAPPPPTGGTNLLDVYTVTADVAAGGTAGLGEAAYDPATHKVTLKGNDVSYGARMVVAIPSEAGKTYTLTWDSIGDVSSSTLNWRVGTTNGGTDIAAGGTLGPTTTPKSVSFAGNGSMIYLRLNRQSSTSTTIMSGMSLTAA